MSFRSGAFGYFRFEEVEAGQTYVVGVASKLYQFAPQAVTVAEDVSDLNFHLDSDFRAYITESEK